MINLELSKILPSRPYIFVAAFLPGLFFEISVILANPDIPSRLLVNFEKNFPPNIYILLFIGLFLAFAIGNGFLLLVSFITYVFGFVYRFLKSLWKQLCRWPLRPLSGWLLAHPKFNRRWLNYLNRYFFFTGYGESPEWRRIVGCWGTIAEHLLRSRYGIDPQKFKPQDRSALFRVLGTATPEESRGLLSMIATHATGWSGLAAIRIAPALRTKYYVWFCLFLILNGLIHDFYVVIRRFNPIAGGYISIRAALREFPKPPLAKPTEGFIPDTEADAV
jgi:hypothetical protein